MLDYLRDNYADQNLQDVPGASVITMMKIPYGKDGDLSIADTDSRAFPDAIVSRTAEKMKFLAKPVPVENAFSKATYVDEDGKTRKVFTKKAEREGKTLKYAKKRLGYGAESAISFDDDVITNHRLSTQDVETRKDLQSKSSLDSRDGRTSGSKDSKTST